MRFALVTSVLVGCGSVEEPKDATPGSPVRPYCTQPQIAGGFTTYADCVYQPQQGTHIIGMTADALATGTMHVAVAPNGSTLTVNAAGTFLVDGAPPADGTQFPTTSGVWFEVSGSARAYTIRYGAQGTDPSTWSSLCDAGELAYAIEGQYDVTGEHFPTGAVTFSCDTHGKAAWCVKLGYAPRAGALGRDTTDPLWQMNQACVHMATANYCAGPHFYTRELTPIAVRDPLGIQFKNESSYMLEKFSQDVIAAPPAKTYLEAVWPPDGPPVCLSKYRWADMPKDPCPAKLPDPRIPGSGGVFCEDFDLDTYAKNNLYYVINGSHVMDVALHTWRNTTGTDAITSVNGYVEKGVATGTTDYPTRVLPPSMSTNEGFMLRTLTGMMTLSTPTDATPIHVTPVYRMRNPTTGDEVAVPAGILPAYAPVSGTALPVAGADAPTIEAHPDFEGFVFDSSFTTGTIPLNLYRNGTNRVTATYTPSGFTFVQTLGTVVAGSP